MAVNVLRNLLPHQLSQICHMKFTWVPYLHYNCMK